MRAFLTSLLAAALLATVSVSHAENSQQDKMKTCNAQAGDKKGDDRKAFMKSCLSAAPAAQEKKLTPQQEKMKTCNAQAGDKKGDDRKAFMKGCLSGKS